MHAFLNGGQLSSLPLTLSSAKPSTLLHETLLRPSTSAGVGLMYEQGALRLELNAGMPLSAARGDGSRKGVQLGVGISFLG
jgi:outer membrane protein insertion porin family